MLSFNFKANHPTALLIAWFVSANRTPQVLAEDFVRFLRSTLFNKPDEQLSLMSVNSFLPTSKVMAAILRSKVRCAMGGFIPRATQAS
jgi:hypothetical protein